MVKSFVSVGLPSAWCSSSLYLYGKVVCFCSLNVFISNSRGKCKRVIGVFALIFSADMGIKRKIFCKFAWNKTER